MPNRPSCNRCGGEHTVYYKHPFEGGMHIGLWCWTCKTHAQTGRTWYQRNWFSEAELAAMLKQSELERDPRQGHLF